MRPVVAIVSARPETIADDYARVLNLAGLGNFGNIGNTIFAVEARHKGWMPGQTCPPWQMEALLEKSSVSGGDPDSAPYLLPVKEDGPFPNLTGFGWNQVLQRHEHRLITEDALLAAPFRPESLLPALEGVLPQGFKISPHLRGEDLLVMSTMGIESGGILGANVAFLDSLLGAGRKSGGKIPEGEVLAEVVVLANEVFSSMAAVTDVTVLSVSRRGGKKVQLVRNLLVAGNDPVSVDSVLISLAGLDKADFPCLQLCQDRGVGVSDRDGIRLVGETEWLDLDFQIPEDTFASGNLAAKWSPGNLLNRTVGGGGDSSSSSQDSAWDRLYRDYQSGVTS